MVLGLFFNPKIIKFSHWFLNNLFFKTKVKNSKQITIQNFSARIFIRINLKPKGKKGHF